MLGSLPLRPFAQTYNTWAHKTSRLLSPGRRCCYTFPEAHKWLHIFSYASTHSPHRPNVLLSTISTARIGSPLLGMGSLSKRKIVPIWLSAYLLAQAKGSIPSFPPSGSRKSMGKIWLASVVLLGHHPPSKVGSPIPFEAWINYRLLQLQRMSG